MNKKLYAWIWKWHFIAGIISLPFIILLSMTGIIYLFKDTYEAQQLANVKSVEVKPQRFSYQKQLEIVLDKWDKKPSAMVVPISESEATEFVSGRFSNKSRFFINPYTGMVKGQIQNNQTDMHQVRKLHGELLLGTYGTKVVELIASWMVVLIISGMYLFWPRDRGVMGLVTVRFNQSKRILFKDLHGVTGFWFSIFILMILAGGLPWTDVWGGGYKWLQNETHSGYTKEWKGVGVVSKEKTHAITLDQMVEKAKMLELEGVTTISIPQKPTGVYGISNQTSNYKALEKYQFDQFTGDQLYHGTWRDIGIMMQARIWFMNFHQGQFGPWNWWLVIFIAIGLLFMSVTALFSYINRKRRGEWNIPKRPKNFKIAKVLVGMIIILGFIFPLFGLSLILIYIGEALFLSKTQ